MLIMLFGDIIYDTNVILGVSKILITDIQKTKKGRYSVFADGEFLFSVHRDSYAKTSLSVGACMTAQQLEQLRQDDQLLSAKAYAMDILSRASQTSGMLLEKLCRYYDEDASELAVERMTELGLVDDADYAARYASDCIKLRGYSLARLRQALRQKKLPREVIDKTLAYYSERDECDPIISLILKKYSDKLFEKDDLRRTVAALQRRGFGYDDIRSALKTIEENELYKL